MKIGTSEIRKHWLDFVPPILIIGWIVLQFGDTVYQPALLSDDFFSIKRTCYDFTVETHLKGFLAPNNSYNNRPLGNLLYAFLFSAFGTKSLPYILVLFGLHMANSTLVFLLSVRLLGDRFIALICSLVFATIYNNANNVYAFPHIFDSLSFFWWAMAFLLYIDNQHNPSKFRYIGSLVCFFLSTRSKEIGITLSPCLLLYEFLYFDWSLLNNRSKFFMVIKDIFKRQVVFHLLALLFVVFFVKGSAHGLHSPPDYPYYLELTPIALLEGLKFYLSMAFLGIGWFNNVVLILLFFGVTLLFGLILRQKAIIWGLGSFIIALLPVIFLVNARRQHYLYLPSFGLILSTVCIVGYSFLRIFRKARNVGVGITYAVLIVIFSLYVSENTKRVNYIGNYFKNVRTSTNTTIGLLKSYYPYLPRNSRLYFISIPPGHLLNIDLGLKYMPKVIYEDTSINAFKIENSSLSKQISNQPDTNFYVFEFVGNAKLNGCPDFSNGIIIDVSEKFRLKV